MQSNDLIIADIKVLLENMEELEKISVNPIISGLSRRALIMQMGDCLSEVIGRCFDLQSDLAGKMEEMPLQSRGAPTVLTPVTHYSSPPPNNGDAIRPTARRNRDVA